MDYTKREAETIIVQADFSSVLVSGEAVESVSVTVLEHGAGSHVEDIELTAADRIAVELSAGQDVTYKRSFDVSLYTDARLVLYAGSDEADGMLDEASVDESGNVLDLFANVAGVRIAAGSAGFSYRVRFTATTSLGCIRVLTRTVEVIP